MPPQHGKSELVHHAIAWLLLQKPLRVIYATYSDDLSTTQMRRARRIAKRAGVAFEPTSRAICEWELANGGGLFAGGIKGSITGKSAQLVVIDDPHKSWAEVQSKRERDKVDEGFRADVMSRIHPGGSVIVVHTRWHEDDLAARLGKRGWEVVNLPAIDTDGNALWGQRPVDFLEKQREELGAFQFEALYQGRPRPIGGEVFGPPTWCSFSDIPAIGRHGIGIDLAYTAKTQADSSVSVLCRRDTDGNTYVLDVQRKQVRADDFAPVLRSHSNRAPGVGLRWYCSGTEKGSAQFLQRMGLPIQAMQVNADKFVRAQPVAAAWNAGKVILPSEASWAPKFVDEVCSFTGVGDAHDDQVDALAAAFDSVATSSGVRGYQSVRRGVTSSIGKLR